MGPLARDPGREDEVVHLARLAGANGPLWGTATDDLNATLLAWDEGRGTPEHVNGACDVLVVVLAGRGTVRLGSTDHSVAAGDAVLIPKGVSRQITAGFGGVRYLTAHVRRGGLAILAGGEVERWRERSLAPPGDSAG